ncbi:MAG: translation initiation factor IF-3 [Clostridia bacterium]|nr:translation initiation factor IF-3 [Clostridia bacterium]
MTRINGMIHAREVRVITETGEQLGIMSSQEALEQAEARNLDLVEIAPQAKPPVCKIMDYGKYRFDKQKQQKEQKKRQHQIEIKEIQFSLNIDTHDIETKANHCKKFLQQGNKVKLAIRFRGREMAHPERGNEIMDRFYDMVNAEVPCVIEKPAKLEGRNMLMFIAPKPGK